MAHSTPHSLAAAAGFVSPALSQRAVTFAAIVGFHIVLVYFLASGLAISTIERVFEPATVEFIPEKPVETLPTPPLNLQFIPPKLDAGPIPENPTSIPDDGGTALTIPKSDPTPVAFTQPTPLDPIHLVGKHQMPNTADYYPPSEIRLGHQGATIVNVCVNESGKRQGEPTVTESSGNARLDQSAIEVARNGRYARSARGETFVPNCYGFRIVFKIR